MLKFAGELAPAAATGPCWSEMKLDCGQDMKWLLCDPNEIRKFISSKKELS
jgi:hypothetical protein